MTHQAARQQLLDSPEHVGPDSLRPDGLGRVQLAEVRRHAREWEARTPGAQTVGSPDNSGARPGGADCARRPG
jgi:hypothetical protein